MRLCFLALLLSCVLPVAAQSSTNSKTNSQGTAAVASRVPAVVPLAHTPQVLDEHYGFRSIKLEADSTMLTGLVFDRRDNDLVYYHRDADSLTWHGAAVSGPGYAFYRGKLLSLSFTTKGAANSHAVLARLQQWYGPGEQKGTQQRYLWRGERALLRYEESSTSNNAVVTLTSLPLTIRRQQDVKGTIEQTAANR